MTPEHPRPIRILIGRLLRATYMLVLIALLLLWLRGVGVIDRASLWGPTTVLSVTTGSGMVVFEYVELDYSRASAFGPIGGRPIQPRPGWEPRYYAVANHESEFTMRDFIAQAESTWWNRWLLPIGFGCSAGHTSSMWFRESPPDASSVQAVVPVWFLMLLAATPWLWWLAGLRRRRRAGAGLCAQCGYDLRGSGDACPECGAGRAP